MSLQVWLPLTKDLRQQGLRNENATSGGTVTLTNTGKLGKCATLGTAAGGITLPASTMTSFTECSVAFWINIISWNTSYATFFQAGLNSTPWNNYIFGILRNNANSNLCFTLTNSSASSSQASYVTSNLNTGQWYHLAFTYTAGTVKTYIDGVLDKTYSTTYVPNFAGITNISIGRCTNNSGYQTNCSLNDFRIYNHCLSPMEVKELAKGLVLHYPLDRQGWGQENLASQYVMPGGNNPGSTATAGRTNYYGDYGIIIPATENADTYFSIWYSEPLESGAVYTLSAEVSGLIGNSYYNFPLFAQNNSSMGSIKFDHNGLNKLTFTMNYTGTITTATVGGKTYYRMFMDDNGRAIASGQGAITIKNIKLEKGSIATPWCPNSSDTLATTMGLNSIIEYDCSGFCNNGEKIGTLTYTSDTPKYAVSTHIDATTTKIHISNLSTSGFGNSYSFAWWAKISSVTPMHWGFSDGIRLNGMYTGRLWNTGDGSNNPLYNIGTTTQVTAPTTNVWHHWVMTGNGTKCYVYQDGELWAEAKTYKAISGTSIYINGWNNATDYSSNNYSISDFRIYATALSADDVKSLYQNSAYIDSSGNVYGTIHEV